MSRYTNFKDKPCKSLIILRKLNSGACNSSKVEQVERKLEFHNCIAVTDYNLREAQEFKGF